MLTRFILAVTTCTACFVFADSSIDASKDLVKRIIPKFADQFHFIKIDKEEGYDVFEIGGDGEGITIKGSSALAMAGGFHWYLKHVAKCHVSWNGDQLNLRTPLPKSAKIIRKCTPYKHGFYFNYCTHSYSMPWWNWERWEREIDYMALCGIDMPLAIVGAEAIWLNFLKRFGYTHQEAKEYICGPGYFAWWLMANLEGRGGPLTDEWFEMRIKLQIKILKRMRELGMRPVMPGFVGIVPTTFSKKNPHAKTLAQGKWGGNNSRPHVLHPADPLFPKMAKAWYEEMEKLYGKSDCFAGDLFHEGGRTHGLNITDMARQVQSYMLDYNANSVWTIQGWGGNPKPALLNGLKKENTMVVELCNEFWTRWEGSKGFQGFPWVFGTVIMYGGNIAYHGRLDSITQNLTKALKSSYKPVALGAVWESIEVNPVVMDFIWDMRWRKSCPDLGKWIAEFATRRYGVDNPKLKLAWGKLLKGPYAGHPGQRRPGESLFCAVPSLNVRKASPFAASCKVHYNQYLVYDAFKLFVDASEKLKNSPTLNYDMVDCGRQFMANLGQLVYKDMIANYKRKDKKAFIESAKLFLEMFDDQDKLLGSNEHFLLGKWLHDARNLGPTFEQADQNERNARLLITTWNEERTMLNNYAWKEWSGMMKCYYKPQWSMFIKSLLQNLTDGGKLQRVNYYSFEKSWAIKNLKNDYYPAKPQGDSALIAKQIIAKYTPIFKKSYKITAKIDRNYFVGIWEYKAQGATWQRRFYDNGKMELYRNGKLWINWKGFTWIFKNGGADLKRANGTIFCHAKMKGKKIDFGGGMMAQRVEDQKNREAELIQK